MHIVCELTSFKPYNPTWQSVAYAVKMFSLGRRKVEIDLLNALVNAVSF